MRVESRVFALTLLFAAAQAPAATWKVDPAHSGASFKIKHMMVTNVRGTMTGMQGTVDLDDKDVTKSKVSATLEAATIDTNEPKRDEHLRSPDFFNVVKHPKVAFDSKSVSGKAGNLKVVGALTMNGVTKDVELAVDGPTAPVRGMGGDQRRGLTATTTVNRKDFNIVWNKTLDGGGLLVGDEVEITLEIELTDNTKASHGAAGAASAPPPLVLNEIIKANLLKSLVKQSSVKAGCGVPDLVFWGGDGPICRGGKICTLFAWLTKAVPGGPCFCGVFEEG